MTIDRTSTSYSYRPLYFTFIFTVLEQPVHEDLGIEMFVRKCIKNMDISWIPIGMDSFYYEHLVKKDDGDKIEYNNTAALLNKSNVDESSRSEDPAELDRQGSGNNGLTRDDFDTAISSAGNIHPSSPSNGNRDGGDNAMRGGGRVQNHGNYGSSAGLGSRDVGELMSAINNISSAMSSIGQRLNNIEQNTPGK